MKKIKWLLFLFLFPVFCIQAADNQAVMKQANLDYKMRNYKKAADAYESIIASGVESSELYYNLGNAWFKQNNLPQAILYYEKALKLSPGDDDIRFNLKLANSRIIDKIDVLPDMFYKRWFTSIRTALSIDQWARLSILSIFIFFIAAGLYLLSKVILLRKLGFWMGIIMFVIAGMSVLFSVKSKQALASERDAIVFSPAVNVKSSPDEMSVDVFVIHEGTKVNINDELGDWYKISLLNGSIGWMQKSDLKAI